MPDPVAPAPARPAAPQIPVQYQRAAELIDALLFDKDIGETVRKKAKEKYADIRLPDDTVNPIVEPLKKQLDELQKTLADERAAREKEKAEAAENKTKTTLQDALEGARKSYNLTEEGFEKMVARMKETGNYSDADAAAAWVISKEPPPASPGSTWGPQRLDPAKGNDDEARKLLLRDPEAFQDAQLNEFMRDPDKYVRDTFGRAA